MAADGGPVTLSVTTTGALESSKAGNDGPAVATLTLTGSGVFQATATAAGPVSLTASSAAGAAGS